MTPVRTPLSLQTLRALTLWVALLLYAAPTLAWAQHNPEQANGSANDGSGGITDKLQIQTGAFLEFVPINAFNVPPLYYGFHLGAQYIFMHSNDNFSLGVNPGVNFSFQYSNIAGTSLLVQTPVFLTARVGANCTKYNTFPVGAGVGIGANYTYINLPYTDGGLLYRLKSGFVAPAASAELTAKLGGSIITLRFHINLLENTDQMQGNPLIPAQEIKLNNWGIGVVYTYNL